MTWRRIGKVWGPDGSREWARSHASLPTVVHVRDDVFRIYFSARDEGNRSVVGSIIAELSETPKVLEAPSEPILLPGTAGSFDDSGIGIGSIVRGDGQDLLYYMGWNLGTLAPWRNSIGLAIGDAAEGRFEKAYLGPLLDRSPEDPYTLSYPWVLRLAPAEWRMWYGSNTAWGASSADMEHVIKAATSADGEQWRRRFEPALGFTEPGEYALARPCVVPMAGGFRMWFATRGDRYRIGAAWSGDGLSWRREDKVWGLTPAPGPWDGEMVCYPCVFRSKHRLMMLYNGDGYGREGFGLAVWEGEIE